MAREWTDTGTWVVKDEEGRLHYRTCRCLTERSLGRFCRLGPVGLPIGFLYPDEAHTMAYELEKRFGYATTVEQLQIR